MSELPTRLAFLDILHVPDRQLHFFRWLLDDGQAGCDQRSFAPNAGAVKALRLYVSSAIKTRTRLSHLQAAMKDQLRIHGLDAFEEVFPEPVRAWLAGYPNKTLLQLSSDHDYMPWEMLHDGADFLGNRFVIVRVPRAPLGEATAALDWVPPAISADGATSQGIVRRYARNAASWPESIVHVIGPDLGLIAQSTASLFDIHAAEVGAAPATAEMILRLSRTTDVLHFTCHGDFDPLPPSLRIGARPPHDSLSLAQARQVSGAMKDGSLVFLNACYSAVAPPCSSQPKCFAWAFWERRRARQIIGTVAEVPSVLADSFARAYYEALLAAARPDFLAAYIVARAKTPEGRIIYTIYGNVARPALPESTRPSGGGQ